MSLVESSALPLVEAVRRWSVSVGIAPSRLPRPDRLEAFDRRPVTGPCRPPTEAVLIEAWEDRHGFRLPHSLRSWLLVSDGLYRLGPLVHPLTAIGPMVPFATVPELFIQPESWFELGNPNAETVCIDLAYRWPGGGCPIFTSGDDATGSPPRLIAPSFEDWFLRLLHERGREYWFDPDFRPLGEPWREHRRYVPAPALPDHLRDLAPRLRPLLAQDSDERTIAHRHRISLGDVEAIFRYLQHTSVEPDADPTNPTIGSQ